MEYIEDQIHGFYKLCQLGFEQGDKRVEKWPLMSGFSPTLALTALYLFSVWAGMKIMRNREPFKFKYILIIYNFVCIAINFHVCSELFLAFIKVGYSYQCHKVDYTDNPDEVRIAKVIWWFYFSKLVELLDTIFIIMRKKNNQVSFLHVYHHATMFPICWLVVKRVAGGQFFIGPMINSFVHVIMYTYYGLAAFGPWIQKYLWWKKYLTILQLTHFVIIGIMHPAQSFWFRCPTPAWVLGPQVIYVTSLLCLFMNFYIRNYILKTSNKDKRE